MPNLDSNEIRSFALSYFEGKATTEQEKYLFDYVKQSESDLQNFRVWEQEWIAAGFSNIQTNREWARLISRIQLRKVEAEEYKAEKRASQRIITWKRVASVAAILILGCFLTIGSWKIKEKLTSEQFYVVEAPAGEKSKVLLSDGTRVWLNAGSVLKYSNNFGLDNRNVELIGEGYFEVAKQNGAYFTVKTDAYSVKVTGTRFDVSAYPEDQSVSTTLSEGRVELLYKNQVIAMSPGEVIHFNKKTSVFERSYVDPSLSYSWAENRFEFDNITLSELLVKLSRQYDVNITLDSVVKEKKFHISLRNNETIKDVLDGLKEIIPIEIEYKDKKNIFINRKKEQ